MKPYALYRGDVLEILPTMADNSFDAIVTDPPYELGFMGKSWDASGIAYNVDMWREALRVLKPGGHLLAFSGSRTYHRMTCAIEDAGFEIRDQIMWVYGSGFPKSLDVSKAIDKAAGAERTEVLGEYRARDLSTCSNNRLGSADAEVKQTIVQHLAPATNAARQWQGWGTALKPAHEPICVARKPLEAGTVAANVLQFGTGALNIAACRVEPTGESRARAGEASKDQRYTEAGSTNFAAKPGVRGGAPEGRWPANLIHDGSDEVRAAFPDAAGQQGDLKETGRARPSSGRFGDMAPPLAHAARIENDKSAARFFYCAKASRADRNEGIGGSDEKAVGTGATMLECEDADWKARNGNHHPTVKPTDLMAHLVRLVTPPGGKVLDLFFGSGSTGKACMREGFQFVGIDLDQDEHGNPAGYLEIATARIEHELERVKAASVPPPPAPQMDLFAVEGGQHLHALSGAENETIIEKATA